MPTLKKIVNKTRVMLEGEQTNILKTSVFLMIVIAITKVSGFLYTAIVASKLGADRPLDLFILANTIPEIIGNLILIGVISAVFIPILIKVQKKGHDKFLEIFNTLLNACVIFFIVLAIVFSIFANDLFRFLLIDSTDAYTPSEITQMVDMMRYLFLPQILLGVSTFYSSGLKVFHRFMIPQLAPLFYNIGRTIGAWVLIPYLGGVQGLVWGTILGSVLHLLIQLPLGRKLGIRHQAKMNLRDEDAIEAIKFGFPRILGLGAQYIGGGINKFIAARYVAGSVSASDFAARLISIPLALFGTTFSTASFPTLSRYYQDGEIEKFKNLFIQLLNEILFLAIPVTVVLLILRVALVRLMFGIFGGAFDFDATYLTAWVVGFYAIGLIFLSIRSIMYRSFYAANDTIHPLYLTIFTLTAGVFMSILFSNYFSHFDALTYNQFEWNPAYFLESSDGRAAVGGLALSSSIVYIVEFFVLIYMFNKYISKINFSEIFDRISKKIISGLLMGISMYLYFKLWGDTFFQTKTFNLIVFVSITITLGMTVYLWVSYMMQIEEFSLFIRFSKKVLPSGITKYIKFIRDYNPDPIITEQ